MPSFGLIDDDNNLIALLFRGNGEADVVHVRLSFDVLETSKSLRDALLKGEVMAKISGVAEGDTFSYLRKYDGAVVLERNSSIIGRLSARLGQRAYPILFDVARFVLTVQS